MPIAPDHERYLQRIGLASRAVEATDRRALIRLQRSHVLSIPFETLAITGDPYREGAGTGVTLALPSLFEKVVEHGRGGFCYELNGLFGWLLSALGFDVDGVAGMVLDADGTARPPANHMTNLVQLDRTYLVDVGMGAPRPREPVPLDGEVVTGRDGVAWQVVDATRPDVDHALRLREPGEEWQRRYVLDTEPREVSYFQATCDYLTTAPESPFTGDPVVVRSTPTGYLKLTPGELIEVDDGEHQTRAITPRTWHQLLQERFDLRAERPGAGTHKGYPPGSRS